MGLDTVLRMAHVAAVVVYLGGGLLLHFSVRRALHAVPPAQGAILGERIGSHFTVLSWAALGVWGVSGYLLLFRSGMADFTSPVTLFLHPALVRTGLGIALLVMIGSWYLLLISAMIITFVLRPRFAHRLQPGAGQDAVDAATQRIVRSARWIDVLAVVNLVLAASAFVAGKLYF
jgi:uncharacterized membrane protein